MPRFNVPIVLGPTGPTIPAFEVFDDFWSAGTTGKFSTTADVGVWLNSTDSSGTVKMVDAAPDGAIRLLPGTSAADYVSIQLNGEAFTTNANRNIYFATRIRTNDADDIKFAIGLHTTAAGTSATVGPVLDGVNNSIGFRNVLGNTTAFLTITEDDTSETTSTPSSGGDLADSTWKKLSFIVYGTNRVEFFIDDVLVATHTAGIPDAGDALTVSFEVGSPTGTTATYLDVDYLYVGVSGERAS